MACEPKKDLELLLYKDEGLFSLKKKKKKIKKKWQYYTIWLDSFNINHTKLAQLVSLERGWYASLSVPNLGYGPEFLVESLFEDTPV